MAVKIIAEAGVNHNGSLELARQMVAAAAEAGADYKISDLYSGETGSCVCPKGGLPETEHQGAGKPVRYAA